MNSNAQTQAIARSLPHALTSAELRSPKVVQLQMSEVQFVLNAAVVPASKIESTVAPT
jgi:hypothetical protein